MTAKRDSKITAIIDAYMKYLFEMIRQEHELAVTLAPTRKEKTFITCMCKELEWLTRDDLTEEAFLKVYYHPNKKGGQP